VIVGGGVVLAASYEAKARGVQSGMGGGRARFLCPDAAVVPCRFEAYVEASKAVFEIFEDTAPTVEALSIDEAFLDVRGMEHFAGTPKEIAARLRARVREEIGLPISVGVARTKFLAKVASAVAKPDGLLVVPPDRELEFLHPLPVERLWGGRRRDGAEAPRRGAAQGQGRRVGVSRGTDGATRERIGAPPACARERARPAAGGAAEAEALDRAPSTRSGGDRVGRRRWTPALVALVDRVTGRLRKAERVARTVVLRLRFSDLQARDAIAHAGRADRSD
jgi:DNA polymerase-4